MKRKMKYHLAVFGIALCLFYLPAPILANESIQTDGLPNSSKVSVKEQMTITTLSELPDVSSKDIINQQVVIIYKNTSPFNVQSLSLSTNEIAGGEAVSDRVDILEVKNGVDIDAFIQMMNENPNVLVADRNRMLRTYALPNDPYVTDGKAWQFLSIGADKTWDQVNNSETIGIAVIDTGLNTTHPDLAGRLIAGYDYITKSTAVIDQDGHGTLVSGFIAATANNGIGLSGVAGTANVKIAPYRVGTKGLSVANICAALMDAADRSDIKVINMSYGGYTYNNSEAAAVQYAKERGKVLVASAGNEGKPTDPEAGSPSYPASYDGVISVAAINSSNQRASFSQYNSLVDLTAPGVNVYTTSISGDYSGDSGTSFSAPIVAGACGVLLAANGNLSAKEVETALTTTALDLGDPGKDDQYGYGLIQLDRALAKVKGAKPLTAINLNKAEMILRAGNSESLTAACFPENTTDDRTIIWTSSNPAVATVDANGKVSAINHGKCTITARASGLSATAQVTVSSLTGDLSALYKTHIQNLGWESDYKINGELSGTSGLGYRLEAITIVLDRPGYDVGVAYKTHIQDIGWQDWRYNGELSGTSGESRRLEAIQIKLTGTDANLFDIYYRTHVQNLGWLNWASADEQSGTAGYGYRLESIQIMVVQKGTPFDTTGDSFITNPL